MTLQVQLYLAAGLGALALGAGALVREPGRQRNRLFALFCAALALWNLAKVAELSGLGLPVPWHVVFLLGACAAVPTGLHFILLVSGLSDQPSRRLLPYAYATTTALWVSALTPVYHRQPAWNLTALVVLGGPGIAGGRELAADLKAAYAEWNPAQAVFFSRLLQGLIRKRWGAPEEGSGSV